MNQLAYTVLADGPTDRSLIPIIEWLLVQSLPNCEFRSDFTVGPGNSSRARDDKTSRTSPLAKSIAYAWTTYPCRLLFVHRDAENQGFEKRSQEIDDARRQSGDPGHIIPVIPVRMTEAWLLFDERAIRAAAGNPNGKVPLDLPRLRSLESLPDPKSVLNDILKKASELSGRRLKSFDDTTARTLVAERIEDFSPLKQLTAFRSLVDEVSKFAMDFLGRSTNSDDEIGSD
jgi:hypothetical protein